MLKQGQGMKHMLLELKSEKDNMLPDKAPKRPVIFTFKTTQKSVLKIMFATVYKKWDNGFIIFIGRVRSIHDNEETESSRQLTHAPFF